MRGSLYFGEEDGRVLVSPRLEPGACPVLSVPVDVGGGDRQVVGVLLGIGVAQNYLYTN